MMTRGALLLTRSDIRRIATREDYHDAVADGFRAFAAGRARSPFPMEIPGEGGAFHIKGASMTIRGRAFTAVKINGNFPANSDAFKLPTIQGVIILADATNGSPVAIIDSTEITARRTAAASAVATDILAKKASATLLICGCGVQAHAHLEAIAPLRDFRCVIAFDAAADRADLFAATAKDMLKIPVTPVDDLISAAATSDVIVTLTTSKAPLPLADAVRPGTFIAAVGADSPAKNEIPPVLMKRSAVVTDVTDQCAVMGDLRAAIDVGAMNRGDVRSELGQILIGAGKGRLTDEEILIFDSTGAAFQDLTVAVMAAERASKGGAGAWIDLQR